MRGMGDAKRSTSMSVDFAGLALSDQAICFFLSGGLHHWVLLTFDANINGVSDILCKMFGLRHLLCLRDLTAGSRGLDDTPHDDSDLAMHTSQARFLAKGTV